MAAPADASQGPLRGRRVLVTRRLEQSVTLRQGLEALGAQVVEVPLLEILAPVDSAPLHRALSRLDHYDWLVFTSANAVEAVGEALRRSERSLPPALRVATVGPATSDAVRGTLAVEVSLEPPTDHSAAGLLSALGEESWEGRRVLLPLGDRAREALADGLRGYGATVDAVVAYRTVARPGSGEELERALRAGVDLVTLASPSAVEALRAAVGERARHLPVAVIGPVTERAARDAGLDVRVVAAPSTAEGLVRAVRDHFRVSAG
jgi:uroporphyrinogen-III synthase